MNSKKLQNEKYHISVGAKMVPFAGYNMPIWYTSIADEHNCVRNNVGIFDVSHMGEFIVSGIESIKFLQKVTSNNIEKSINTVWNIENEKNLEHLISMLTL